MQNFLESFWKVHGVQEAVVSGEAVSDEYQQMSHAKLSAGLEKFFGEKCKAKKLEDVDMKGKLEEIGLLPFFHVDLWPAAAAVRELATQMKTRTGFIYAELRKCVVCCSWMGLRFGCLCGLLGSCRIVAGCMSLLSSRQMMEAMRCW